ncbi:septation ring formation regulator EzrA [Furfurilactobacillus sp. WILCCON 0119]|uniref:septation ring formation regulator EzrA n=1 Tax=Furfurilactobacillus entadae TaxID=2922307 RepID=UPI0035E804F5
MIQVLIGIVVLAVILYGSVFAFQRITTHKVSVLRDRLVDLQQLGVGDQVEAGRQMSLTGQSLAAFDSLIEEYRDVMERTLPALNRTLDEVTLDVRGINFVKTHNEQKQAEELATLAEERLEHVHNGLIELKKVDQEHHEAVDRLEKKYQDLRKVLLSQNLSFGPSIDQLEAQLAQLEDQFDEFTTLSSQGDHVAAQAVLEQLTTDTDALEQLIAAIPALYDDLKTGFNDQLNDITEGYQQLIAQNYVFDHVDVLGQVNQARHEIQAATQELANLDLTTVTTANKDIAAQIDALYDVMEQEMTAKETVGKQQKEVHDFVVHAQRQNHALQIEIDRLSQSYVLDHGEENNAKSMSDEIQRVVEQQQTDENGLVTHTVSFSTVAKHQLAQLEALRNIEQRQRQINTSIQDLGTHEKAARDRFQQFDNQMHTIKRQIEGLNLPGLPEDYLDYFYVVSDEVEKLGKSLSRTRINMEDITKQLVMIQADMSTLNEKSQDLRDSALLAEQLMQYANRYRQNNEIMATAWTKAQREFGQQYRYAEALETMASALDQVEPGAYKRIENNYYGSQGVQE